MRIHDRALGKATTADSASAGLKPGGYDSPRPGGDDSPRATPSDAVLCDRCRAEMFRMHAVWRCPACGYKTDCCGW